MLVILGTSQYGKVDRVPNLCHVSTRFFHINYLPLIPLESYIVLAGSEEGSNFRGVRISLSPKSVLFGWARAALILTALVAVPVGVGTAVEFFNQAPANRSVEAAATPWAVLAAAVFAYWLTHRFAAAGYDRALDLGRQLGLDPAVVEQILQANRDEGRRADSGPPPGDGEPAGYERYN
jgi:hypothetical protein